MVIWSGTFSTPLEGWMRGAVVIRTQARDIASQGRDATFRTATDDRQVCS